MARERRVGSHCVLLAYQGSCCFLCKGALGSPGAQGALNKGPFNPLLLIIEGLSPVHASFIHFVPHSLHSCCVLGSMFTLRRLRETRKAVFVLKMLTVCLLVGIKVSGAPARDTKQAHEKLEE